MTIVFCLSLISTLIAATSIDIKVLRKLIALISWAQFIVLSYSTLPIFNESTQKIVVAPECSMDKLSACFLLLTYFVCATSLTHAGMYFSFKTKFGKDVEVRHEKLFYIAAQILILAMSLVFVVENLGLLWVAIETTTLLSAPFVYFARTKNALEATWKYLIVCSVGIAFALLGTILIFAASQNGLTGEETLNFNILCSNAAQLQPRLIQLGYIFCLLGYGTKAGVFPLHTWLPDAYSEAPAPAAAMLSGALVNCSLFAIWKITHLVALSSHHSLAVTLPLTWGAITAVAGSLFLLNQNGIKRLWAYSSVENVGLMLASIGLGLPFLFFFQALNHSLAKVALFLISGNIVQVTGTKEISKLRGILSSAPIWGLGLAIAAAAVTGMPPFGGFFSEILILAQTTDINQYINMCLILFALILSFIAISVKISKILWGQPRNDAPALSTSTFVASSAMPILLCLCALLCGLTGIPKIFFQSL